MQDIEIRDREPGGDHVYQVPEAGSSNSTVRVRRPNAKGDVPVATKPFAADINECGRAEDSTVQVWENDVRIILAKGDADSITGFAPQ